MSFIESGKDCLLLGMEEIRLSFNVLLSMKKIILSFIEQAALAGGVSESLHSDCGGGGLGGRGTYATKVAGLRILWIEKVSSVVLGF